MVLDFTDGVNMRLAFEQREEFIDFLKLRYTSFCPNVRLKIFGIPEDSLKDYKGSSSQNKYAFDSEPD